MTRLALLILLTLTGCPEQRTAPRYLSLTDLFEQTERAKGRCYHCKSRDLWEDDYSWQCRNCRRFYIWNSIGGRKAEGK